jgi:hypothetical protein
MFGQRVSRCVVLSFRLNHCRTDIILFGYVSHEIHMYLSTNVEF